MDKENKDMAPASGTGPSQAEPASRPSRASVPDAAEFDVGTYDDGSGPIARISYDIRSAHTPDCVWVDHGVGSDRWIAFNWRHAADICAGIMHAAQAIEARRAETGTGSVHESAVATPCATPPSQPSAPSQEQSK